MSLQVGVSQPSTVAIEEYRNVTIEMLDAHVSALAYAFALARENDAVRIVTGDDDLL